MTTAQTIWQASGNIEGEYTQSTAVAIVDPSAEAIVDPSAVSLYDTGVDFTPTVNTVWTQDDSA